MIFKLLNGVNINFTIPGQTDQTGWAEEQSELHPKSTVKKGHYTEEELEEIKKDAAIIEILNNITRENKEEEARIAKGEKSKPFAFFSEETKQQFAKAMGLDIEYGKGKEKSKILANRFPVFMHLLIFKILLMLMRMNVVANDAQAKKEFEDNPDKYLRKGQKHNGKELKKDCLITSDIAEELLKKDTSDIKVSFKDLFFQIPTFVCSFQFWRLTMALDVKYRDELKKSSAELAQSMQEDPVLQSLIKKMCDEIEKSEEKSSIGAKVFEIVKQKIEDKRNQKSDDLTRKDLYDIFQESTEEIRQTELLQNPITKIDDVHSLSNIIGDSALNIATAG